MKNVLRALALTSLLGIGAAAAQAQVGIYVGARIPYGAAVVAVPPCPGPGYFWSAGYYDGPVFVPGRWIYRGYDDYPRAYRDYDHDHYRAYDHDGWRDRHEDHWDRGHDGHRDWR